MSSTPTSPTSPGSPSEFIYRVILSYVPQHDGQIPLTTGDIVTDAKDLGNGWTLGRNVTRDGVGIFPSKCIRPVSDVAAPEQLTPPAASAATPTIPRSKKGAGGARSAASPPGTGHAPVPPAKPQRTTSVLSYQPQKKVKLPGDDIRAPEAPTTSKPTVPGSRASDAYPASAARSDPDRAPIVADGLLSPDSNPTPTDGQAESASDADLTPSDAEYSSNSLTTPKRGRCAASQKPHMVVKPNQGKGNGRMEPIPTSAQDDGEPSPSQPRLAAAAAERYGASKVRTSNPPGQLSLVKPASHPRTPADVIEVDGEASRDAERAPPRAAAGVRLEVIAARQDRSTSPINVNSAGPPGIERTSSLPAAATDFGRESDRDNVANECLQQSPYAHRRGEKYASINKPYYRDYRTMECPADGNYATHLRYKPILKHRHQKVADSKGQHIYYHEEKEKNSSFRLVLSILAGLLFGLVMFLWMYYHLEYPFVVAVGICSALAMLLVVLFALSRMCRCMAAILVPSLCTTRGRLAFLILITGFLLGGPATNIYRNMSEVSRSMSCSAERTYNQTMLLLKPFDAMMIQLNSTIVHLQQSAYRVHKGLKPLEEGLDMVEMDVYNGKVQLLGTRKTCINLVNTAFNACSTGIYNAQNQCLGVMAALGTVYHHARDILDKINPEHWAPKHLLLKKRQVVLEGIDAEMETLELPNTDRDICEDLDMATVCARLNDSDTLCQPSSWAGEAIQEAVNATQAAMRSLEDALQFRVSSEPYNSTRVRASKIIYEVQIHVQRDFAEKTTNFELAIRIVLKVVPAAVLLVVYVAYSHVKLYLCSDTYDNTYVTEHFKMLDQKRSEVAGESLLPLKRYERNYLIDTTSSDLSPPEDGLYRIGLCVLVLHFLLSMTCYVFDYILFWILALIEKYARPSFDASGRDSLELVVTGEGVIADLLNVFLRGFHPGQGFGFPEDARACLAKPSEPSVVCLLVVCFMYFAVLLTILLKAYILRFRNRITGFFYPERRKARIVHLYNVILNQRTRMPKLLHQRARLNYREQQILERVSFCHQVADRCAPCRVFLYKSSRCLVCRAVEDQSFRDCETEKCYGVYCAECYDDLGRVCPLCLHGMEYSDDDDMYEELEDDLQPYHRSSKIYL